MRKLSFLTVLLSILTLAIFAGCSSSSDDNGGGTPPPPPTPTDTRVGTYRIDRIVVTSKYDTNNNQQIMKFGGEMIIKNDLSIEGKYQIAGYAEIANRPSGQDPKKLITYNKFAATSPTAANFLVTGSSATLTVTDNAGVVLNLTVTQTKTTVPTGISYVPWTSDVSVGNPLFRNDPFYTAIPPVRNPMNLIGNYVISSVAITKNGTTTTIDHSNTDTKLVGELAVTAAVTETDVKLNITVKMQIADADATAANFQTYTYEGITDTILLSGQTGSLDEFLDQIFIDEGMNMLDQNASIEYSPKQRNQDGTTFSDFEIDGAKVKLTLTKIILGYPNTASEKPVTDGRYWN